MPLLFTNHMLFSEQIPKPQSCPDSHVNACSDNAHASMSLLFLIFYFALNIFSEQKFAFTNISRMEVKRVLHAMEADSWFLFK